MNRILPILIILTSLLIMVIGYLLIPQEAHPEALLGAGIGLAFVIALAAILFRKGLIVPILIFVVMALTACGSDPLGLVAAQRIRTDGDVEIARIERSTIGARIGGAIALAGIAALTVIGVSLIAGGTHIVAQRDRLSMDDWRNRLPVVRTPAAHAVTDGRRPGAKSMPLLRLTRGYRAPSPTLALPEHSETRRNEVVIIDA